ncbi:hypothetical protein CRUP_010045 [Coryphaenoides rupestris]|nr:hypothetical protein CRUP_010045 [Coryphaenoides rupestris]
MMLPRRHDSEDEEEEDDEEDSDSNEEEKVEDLNDEDEGEQLASKPPGADDASATEEEATAHFLQDLSAVSAPSDYLVTALKSSSLVPPCGRIKTPQWRCSDNLVAILLVR